MMWSLLRRIPTCMRTLLAPGALTELIKMIFHWTIHSALQVGLWAQCNVHGSVVGLVTGLHSDTLAFGLRLDLRGLGLCLGLCLGL